MTGMDLSPGEKWLAVGCLVGAVLIGLTALDLLAHGWIVTRLGRDIVTGAEALNREAARGD